MKRTLLTFILVFISSTYGSTDKKSYSITATERQQYNRIDSKKFQRKMSKLTGVITPVKVGLTEVPIDYFGFKDIIHDFGIITIEKTKKNAITFYNQATQLKKELAAKIKLSGLFSVESLTVKGQDHLLYKNDFMEERLIRILNQVMGIRSFKEITFSNSLSDLKCSIERDDKQFVCLQTWKSLITIVDYN